MVMREIWFHSIRDWPERLTSELWNVTWSAFTMSKKWHYHCNASRSSDLYLPETWEDGMQYQDPGSKVHGANMEPTWALSAPDGQHVGPMNLAIRGSRSIYEKWLSSPNFYVFHTVVHNLPWWMYVKQVWVTLDIHAGRGFKYTSSPCFNRSEFSSC